MENLFSTALWRTLSKALKKSLEHTLWICLMHSVHTGLSPSYLSDLVTATADLSSHQALGSANSKCYEVLRTKLEFGQRAFSFAGPSAWNSLPPDLLTQSDYKTFKKQLKTFVFAAAYDWLTVMKCATGHYWCKRPSRNVVFAWCLKICFFWNEGIRVAVVEALVGMQTAQRN
jgi:hypothetical protein